MAGRAAADRRRRRRGSAAGRGRREQAVGPVVRWWRVRGQQQCFSSLSSPATLV
jgi:hypothetical protein